MDFGKWLYLILWSIGMMVAAMVAFFNLKSRQKSDYVELLEKKMDKDEAVEKLNQILLNQEKMRTEILLKQTETSAEVRNLPCRQANWKTGDCQA